MKIGTKMALLWVAVGLVGCNSAEFQAMKGTGQVNATMGDSSTNSSNVGTTTPAVNAATTSTPVTAAVATPVVPGGAAKSFQSLSIPIPNQPTTSVPDPEQPGICYDVTCTSDAYGMKTIAAATNQQGIITLLSPTTGSTWLVQVDSNHQVSTSLNCYPDQLTGVPPDFVGSSLCQQQAAASVGLYAPGAYNGAALTFNQGQGRNLRTCDLTPCGFMVTDFAANTSGHYEWVAASLNMVSGAANVKVRFVDYANKFQPGRYGIDSTVLPGKCDTQTQSVFDSSAGWNTTMVYTICQDNAKVVTIQSGIKTYRLDLSNLVVSDSSAPAASSFTPPPAPTTCSFTLGSGGMGSTSNISQGDCAAWCRLNSNGNPGNKLSCSYNSSPLSF